MNKVKKSEQVPSIDQKVQRDAVDGRVPNREEIRQWIARDMKGAYVMLAEVLQSKECIEALTKVFFDRAVKYYEQQKREPEIDYNARPGVEYPKVDLDQAHNAARRAAVEELRKEADQDGL